MRGSPRDLKIKVLIPPGKVPALLPAGCLPESEHLGWDGIVDVEAPENFGIQTFNDDFVKWIVRAESSVSDILSLSGAERMHTCSRSKGHKFSIQPAIGRPGSNSPRLSNVTQAWKCISVWFSDMLCALKPSASTALKNRAARAKWHIRFHCWDHLGESSHACAVVAWMRNIPCVSFECRVSLVFLQWVARTIADRAMHYDCRKAELSYKSWLADGPGAGISKLHRMTRVQGGWFPSTVSVCPYMADHAAPTDADDNDADSAGDPLDLISESALEQPLVAPLSSLDEANHLAGTWGKEWGVGTSQPSICWPDFAEQPCLPDLSCQLVRKACATFPCGSGLGWDKFHPRSLVRLSDAALLALIRLFILAELLGQWPSLIGIVIVCLVPKADGGRRPIGLLPSLIRLWMRLRLDIVRVWQLQHGRSYFYAGPLKAPQ